MCLCGHLMVMIIFVYSIEIGVNFADIPSADRIIGERCLSPLSLHSEGRIADSFLAQPCYW